MGEITEALRRAEREREGRLRVRQAARTADRVHDQKRPADDAGNATACGANAAAPEPRPGRGATVIPFPAASAPCAGLARPAVRVQIPPNRIGFWQPRLLALPCPGPLAEHYRHFAVRLSRELEGRKTNSVLITSPGRGDGRTTTAFNLALALASISAGRRVALVDLDLRHPSIARALELDVQGGIEAVLAGTVSLASACARTDYPALDVFLAGAPPPDAHALLAGDRLPAFVHELSMAYHAVVFDSPPVLPVPDAALIGASVGTCIPVLRAGFTRYAELDAMTSILPNEKIIGAFLNTSRPITANEHSRYHDPGAPRGRA